LLEAHRDQLFDQWSGKWLVDGEAQGTCRRMSRIVCRSRASVLRWGGPRAVLA